MENEKKKQPKIKYYNGDRIKKLNTEYNVILGERSNGKSYYWLLEYLKEDFKNGTQTAYIRRFEDNIKGENVLKAYSNIIGNNEISKFTNNKWNTLYCRNRNLYFCKVNDNGEIEELSDKPCVWSFCISKEESYKSTGFPDIRNVIFDEFTTKEYYLPHEFTKFCHLLSTIIRLRDDLHITLIGNTVNHYSPYFIEMGLKNIKKMTPNTFDIYEYNYYDEIEKKTKQMHVTVEFTDVITSKPSNKYFAFDNPSLNVIRGDGNVWELEFYPHLPVDNYVKNEIELTFYIKFYDEKLTCDVINIDDNLFIYVMPKTTPLKDNNDDLIYCNEPNFKRNYNINIYKPRNKCETVIANLVKHKKVFYANNECGEIMTNFLKFCELA